MVIPRVSTPQKGIAMRKLVFGGVALLSFVSVASATPTGSLTTNGCPGNQVVVTATTIDWDPSGTGVGCIVTGGSTSITYAGGVLGASQTGSIKDLIAPVAFPLADFMTFAAHPLLHFNLSGIGPGPVRTDCGALLEFESCSVFAGSPFALQKNGVQTAVFLNAFGFATDGTLPNSAWQGSFSVTISNLTPAQIQTIILGGGSVTSTHAGNFTVTALPEPASLVMVGLGLAGLGLYSKRKR
jgi:hypothetical protein